MQNRDFSGSTPASLATYITDKQRLAEKRPRATAGSGLRQPSKIKAKATMSKTDNNANTTDSVSSRIRYRLQNAGVRFHANDNIADFIEAMNWICCNRKWQKKCRGAGKPGH
jgi:hypothetical protein